MNHNTGDFNYIPMDEQDVIVIRNQVRWLRVLRWFGAQKLLRALVDRAFERSWITSRGYHDMHALIARLFALILTLALAGCSNETHDPHAGKVQDGVNSQFGGGNN